MEYWDEESNTIPMEKRIETVYVTAELLKPADYNPRKHEANAEAKLKESIGIKAKMGA